MEVNAAKTRYLLKAQLSSGEVVDLTNLVLSLSWSDPPEEIAQRANIELANTKTQLGYVSDILQLFTLLYIFADNEPVFEGIIWEWEYKSALEKKISMTAYNRIIMTTKSKDSVYYSAGKSTQDIIGDICNHWEIPLHYSYGNHTHPIVKYSSMTVSEQILQTLDDAKKKLGTKYVIYMKQEELYIQEYGFNEEVFVFTGINVINTTNKLSLDQFVTKVVILGKEPSEGRPPILETLTGKMEYGTLQEVVTSSDNTKLDDAKKEAENIIKERGIPKETISVSAPDVPQIRKGYKIKVIAGNLSGYFYVQGVTHEATGRTMDMELIRV